MVMAYVRGVELNLRTVDAVPANLREDVVALLTERGYFEDVTE